MPLVPSILPRGVGDPYNGAVLKRMLRVYAVLGVPDMCSILVIDKPLPRRIYQ